MTLGDCVEATIDSYRDIVETQMASPGTVLSTVGIPRGLCGHLSARGRGGPHEHGATADMVNPCTGDSPCTVAERWP